MAALIHRESEFEGYSLTELEEELKVLDIDDDGIISPEDLSTFLNRKKYMQGAAPGAMRKTLFPKLKLDEGTEKLIAELKQSIARKNYSLYDFFNLIDTNKDGLLTVDELCTGLDKLAKFDSTQKDAIFSYLDKAGHGIIPYKVFVEQLGGKKEDTEDEKVFNWSEEVLSRIKEWYRTSGMSAEAAFNLVDKNFDGVVCESDLKHFLHKYVGIHKSEFTPVRMIRLKKLIDTYKRERLDLSDFKRLFDGDMGL